MMYLKSPPNPKILFNEVDSITDVGQLRSSVKTLIVENSKLSRTAKVAISSLKNQYTLVGFLQQTLITVFTKNKMQANELCELFGRELLSKFEDVARCQTIISKMARDYVFEDVDREVLEELKRIAHSIPLVDVKYAKDRCVKFLERFWKRDTHSEGTVSQSEVEDQEDDAETVRSKSSRQYGEFQNGRINTFINKSRSTPQKLPRTESRRRKRRMSSCSEASHKSTEPPKVPRKRGRPPKRKLEAEETEHESKASRSRRSVSAGPSVSARKTRSASVDSKLSVGSNCSVTSNLSIESTSSIQRLPKLKEAVVQLTDIMCDPSLKNSEAVAQYKQSSSGTTKDVVESDYEVVDDVDVSDDDCKLFDDESDDIDVENSGDESVSSPFKSKISTHVLDDNSDSDNPKHATTSLKSHHCGDDVAASRFSPTPNGSEDLGANSDDTEDLFNEGRPL